MKTFTQDEVNHLLTAAYFKSRKNFLNTLIKEGYLIGEKFIPAEKPFHGNCCCCQTCGRAHDECVCSHNELLKAIYG